MHKQSFFLLSWLVFLLTTPAWAITPEQLLPAEEAFQFKASVENPDKLLLSWRIHDGYYLYRKKISIVTLTPDIKTGEIALPSGQTKQDPFFGTVEIYRDQVDVEIPILRQNLKPTTLTLETNFQGCSDEGICYMPERKVISFDLPVDTTGSTSSPVQSSPFIAEHARIASLLANGSLWLTTLSFLGFGLLLAFTPCILPMIPIISGIVAGHGKQLTTRRAFALSLSYVMASALTYTVFGVMAGLFGSNLQAFFQTPWVIMIFSGVFILLALSLFGAFSIQMPSSLQTRINALSARQQGGHWLSAAMMGMFSTLAIGPCVTAPLAGILLYIGQSGDPVLGGLALFALGLGMGIPLLVIGTSAGKLLPKTGAWMNASKAILGFGLLAVAVWLLGRVISPTATRVLWGMLLLSPLVFLIGNKRWKSAAWLFSIYGLLMLIANQAYQREFVELLCSAAEACENQPGLNFEKISTIDELQSKLQDAHNKKQWIMLDVYADWCVSCQEMEHSTFADPKIQSALANVTLLKADVTQNLVTDQSLLKRFNLIGPPAILFFGPDQRERTAHRIVGYMGSASFLDITHQLFSQ